MTNERYILCKKFIEEGRWKIDLVNGIVIGRNGSTGSLTRGGYLALTPKYNGKNTQFKVHEIIAVAGGLNPIDATIDHINGDNQDNRLCNLQIMSAHDNNSKGHTGIIPANRKLSRQDAAEIKLLLADNKLSKSVIAWLYGVTATNIIDINKNKIWKDVSIREVL